LVAHIVYNLSFATAKRITAIGELLSR